MDNTADHRAERPRDPSPLAPVGAIPAHVRRRRRPAQPDGAPQRWSPPRQGSGEVLLSVPRLPGRSPVQPLDSFLACGTPARALPAGTRGSGWETPSGQGVSSGQGAG